MFISPWASHYDVEDEHRKLYNGIFDWIHGARRYSSKVDKCLITLMTLILLHNTDGMKPEPFYDIGNIQNAQQKYVNLLHNCIVHPLLTLSIMVSMPIGQGWNEVLKIRKKMSPVI